MRCGVDALRWWWILATSERAEIRACCPRLGRVADSCQRRDRGPECPMVAAMWSIIEWVPWLLRKVGDSDGVRWIFRASNIELTC